MRAPADRSPHRRRRVRGRAGFTLLEVMIAMTLLLIGGVSILSVFSLAVSHRVERDVEARLDVVRPLARTLAQEAVDAAPAGKPPEPIVDAPTGQTGFTVSVRFVRSPNDDPAWVASISIAYMGTPLRNGFLPPLWLHRSTLDRAR
jgi:prepilin-type N-terminal cleavage/methylation domain-containing protein